jgi:hypothetical protein
MNNLTQLPATQSCGFPSAQEIAIMKDLGNMAIKSGFIPSSIKTPEQAVIILLKGKELGLPPMQAFSSIAVVNGKPTMSAELMMSMIYKYNQGAVIDFVRSDSTECTIEASRQRGYKKATFSFSIDDAKRAGLMTKQPWQQYPAAMLRARCISAMARAMFPDALSGVVYTPEELGASSIEIEGEVLTNESLAKSPAVMVTAEAVLKPIAAATPIDTNAVSDCPPHTHTSSVVSQVSEHKEPATSQVLNGVAAATVSPKNPAAAYIMKIGQYAGKALDEIPDLHKYFERAKEAATKKKPTAAWAEAIAAYDEMLIIENELNGDGVL